MRLFDKALTQAPKHCRDSLNNYLKEPGFACVIADEIAVHYGESKQLSWSPEDYPYCVLPWPAAFIEWHEPPQTITEKGVVIGKPSNQIGCSLVSLDDPNAVPRHCAFIEKMCGTEVDKDKIKDASRIIQFDPVFFCQSQVCAPAISVILFTNNEGLVLHRAILGSEVKHYFEAMGKENALAFFDNYTHMIGLTLTFLNCKNVQTEDRTQEFQPKEKIRRRLKLPEIKRYTLSINGSSTSRGSGSKQSEFGVMPFHLCRGHFATYTKEKPLFGKYAGKFWIAAHTRGQKERGEIIKDYEVQCG